VVSSSALICGIAKV